MGEAPGVLLDQVRPEVEGDVAEEHDEVDDGGDDAERFGPSKGDHAQTSDETHPHTHTHVVMAMVLCVCACV